MRCVEWREVRHHELIFVIGEYTAAGWEFFARST